MHRRVTFADEVTVKLPEPPSERIRKQLEGSELKRKQRKVEKRWLQYSILCDMHEYANCHLARDAFEESVMELSLDDMTSLESMYNEVYDTSEAITVLTDYEVRSSLDRIKSESLLNSSMGAASSDSGFSEESYDEVIYEIADDTCKQLLMYCETNSDRRNAAIISSLLQENTPELFVNARHCISGVGVTSLMMFAHRCGDIHTSLSAILAWMKEADRCKNASMTTWCSNHGVNVGTLKRIMEYVNELDYIWKNNDTSRDFLLESHEYVDDKISTMLTAAYEHNLCYYLGHPDLGYKSFLTGEQIQCCPASSLCLLENLPEFVLCCRPRHQHSGNEQPCHYMVALDDCEGLSLAHELFSTYMEGCDCFLDNKVSTVSESISCGTYTCRKLRELWTCSTQAGDNLQQELSTIIHNNHTVLDIIENREIKIYAPARYHKQVLGFVQEQLQKIKHSIPRRKITQSYPKQHSDLKLLVCPGVQCEEVYLPGDYIPKRDLDLPICEKQLVFQMSTDVHMEVKIIINSCNDVADCVARLIGRLLASIHNKLWKLQDLTIGKSSVIAQLLFKSHVAARRAVLLVADEPQMEITNSADTECQCRSLKLHINGIMFATIGDLVIAKLEQLSHSAKYNIQYDITVDHLRNTIISITTMTLFQVTDIFQKIQQLFVPLKFTPPEVQNMTIEMRSETCTFILDHIGKLTGTWLHLSRNIKDNVIYIYGPHKSKKEANSFLQKYMHRDFKKIWKLEGKPLSVLNVLPCDFLLRLNKNATISSDSEQEDSFFHVDFSRRMVWSQSPSNVLGASSVFLREHMVHLLRSEYGVEISEDLIDFQFQVSPDVIDSCVACFSETTDFYILDGCGHVYCCECLNTQLETSLRENILPICCAECSMLFSTTDIHNMIKCGSLPACKRQKMYQAALGGFVAHNHELFRFCPKPNCSGVFKKHSKADGGFICGACGTDICDNCYERVHYDMDCTEYMDIGKWMDEDPKNRKRCPKCSMRIEKDGGCNNIRCQHCSTSVCWVCLKFDENSTNIYNHMHKANHWR